MKRKFVSCVETKRKEIEKPPIFFLFRFVTFCGSRPEDSMCADFCFFWLWWHYEENYSKKVRISLFYFVESWINFSLHIVQNLWYAIFFKQQKIIEHFNHRILEIWNYFQIAYTTFSNFFCSLSDSKFDQLSQK